VEDTREKRTAESGAVWAEEDCCLLRQCHAPLFFADDRCRTERKLRGEARTAFPAAACAFAACHS